MNCFVCEKEILERKCYSCKGIIKECDKCLKYKINHYYQRFLELHQDKILFAEKINYLKGIEEYLKREDKDKCFTCVI